MRERYPFHGQLPDDAAGALAIVQALANAGYQALLAGGCVRDLLLGNIPSDYDVATDAPPERLCELFPRARKVGVQFGVVLVKKRKRWVEVATFRADGPYLDGRRPIKVTLTDARHDALRRDFTINGMFLDPGARHVVDYVGGQADLTARLIRAIGRPEERFQEDHLRLLRAVRFAARLGFEIEPVTLSAIRHHASKLTRVAAERVREELEKTLAHPTRQRAWSLLGDCGLLPHLWPAADWSPQQRQRVATLLGRLPADAPAELALGIMLADRSQGEIERVARTLTLSNEQRETIQWLVAHQADLDQPQALALADLKRLMANPAFPALLAWACARHQDWPDGSTRRATLDHRVRAIPRAHVQPAPLVTGDDLLSRGLPPGPAFKEILDALYTRQLAEELLSREQALAALDELLADRARARGA